MHEILEYIYSYMSKQAFTHELMLHGHICRSYLHTYVYLNKYRVAVLYKYVITELNIKFHLVDSTHQMETTSKEKSDTFLRAPACTCAFTEQ